MEYIQEIADKTRDYNEYIREHRNNVFKAWQEMQIKCKDEPFIVDDWLYGIITQEIKYHDMTKYSSEEFTQYRKNFYPCSEEEKDKAEFEKACKHHYANNSHHWQYWINDDGTFKKAVPWDMMIAYVEMVCDWTAMAYKFGDNALSYYEKNKNEIKIEPEHIEFIERILKSMASQLE